MGVRLFAVELPSRLETAVSESLDAEDRMMSVRSWHAPSIDRDEVDRAIVAVDHIAVDALKKGAHVIREDAMRAPFDDWLSRDYTPAYQSSIAGLDDLLGSNNVLVLASESSDEVWIEAIHEFLGKDIALRHGGPRTGDAFTYEEIDLISRLGFAGVEGEWVGELGAAILKSPGRRTPSGFRLPPLLVDHLAKRFESELRWVNEQIDMGVKVAIQRGRHRADDLVATWWGSDHYALAGALALAGGAPDLEDGEDLDEW